MHDRSEASGRWFYAGMAALLLVLAAAGFLPGLLDEDVRRAPVTPLVAVHAVAVTGWLVLLGAQSALVATRRVGLHRRLGVGGAVLAVIVAVTSYLVTVEMARRGFRLADGFDTSDMASHLILPLGDLATFTVLTAAALWLRRKPAAHRRLMLLGSVGGLAPASVAHFVAYFGLSPLVTLLVVTALLFAPALRDRLSTGRAHPVALYGAVGIFCWLILEVGVIGPSSAWRGVAEWLMT